MRMSDLYYNIDTGEIKSIKDWLDLFNRANYKNIDSYSLFLDKVKYKKLIKQN